MGIFDRLKQTFKKETKEVSKEETKEIKLYDQGLTKTRDNFVSKLLNIKSKYNKIT